VTLSNLASAGKVTFGLSGQNGTPVPITATISDPNDLSPLAKEINTYSDQTGIRAELSTDRKSLTLISDQGDDIKVTNFQLGDTATEAEVIQVDGVPLNEIGALDKEGNLIGTGGSLLQERCRSILPSISRSPARIPQTPCSNRRSMALCPQCKI